MGGNLQNNPPLFPEIYAALGALRFFSEENINYVLYSFRGEIFIGIVLFFVMD